MCMLPEDILNKIMLFNSHPIADMFKQSSIFKYLKLRETSIDNDRDRSLDCYSHSFDLGCGNGLKTCGNSHSFLILG